MGKLNRRIFLPQADWTVPQPRRRTIRTTTHLPDLRQEPRGRKLLSTKPPADRSPMEIPWIEAPGGAPAWEESCPSPSPAPGAPPTSKRLWNSPHLEEPGAKRRNSRFGILVLSFAQESPKKMYGLTAGTACCFFQKINIYKLRVEDSKNQSLFPTKSTNIP